MKDGVDTRGDHVWACLMIADGDAEDKGFGISTRKNIFGLITVCGENTCDGCGIGQLCNSNGLYNRRARWKSFKYHNSKVE